MLNFGGGLYVLRVVDNFYALQMMGRKVWQVFPLGPSTTALLTWLAKVESRHSTFTEVGEFHYCSFREVRRRLYGKGV